ncbi:MAG: hypothetical protein E2O73_06340 [Deltaproteobacteria bacterium]|nr:MAG: hypothetical protein E2O73_06340 [Deltaproteobacteria bacterium]TDJ09703.1 MAG: hypothetical protein E2O71_01630 [Deltaproteobacteria bacterium]
MPKSRRREERKRTAEQLPTVRFLGPSVGIELRSILEQTDPRAAYPGVYEVIFGRAWSTEPGPKALNRNHLRQMVRDVRDAVKRLHPRLLARFRALEPAIRGAGLELLTQYRIWLAVRFLVDGQGHSEAVAAFRQSARRLLSNGSRKQIVAAVECLRGALEASPEASPVPLPDIAYGWPPELRQLANSVAGLEDLERMLQQYVESAEVRLICDEQPAAQSAVRDPVVHVAIRALDRVLELDPKRLMPRSRLQLLGIILDAILPRGYQSDAHPFGSREPRGKWSEAAIQQHAETPAAMEEIV